MYHASALIIFIDDNGKKSYHLLRFYDVPGSVLCIYVTALKPFHMVFDHTGRCLQEYTKVVWTGTVGGMPSKQYC